MPKGYLITVAASLIRGEPYYQPGVVFQMPGVEGDAAAVAAQATAQGFSVLAHLKSEAATAAAFVQALNTAATTAVAGDLVVIHYAGHGTILRASSLYEDPTSNKVDYLNAALVLYDRPYLDDELYAAYARFAPGTRVLVLVDCCYAGGMNDGLLAPPLATQAVPPPPSSGGGTARSLRSRRTNRLPSPLERDFLGWFDGSRNHEEESFRLARRYPGFFPPHLAERAYYANLDAYRASLPDRLFPNDRRDFESPRLVHPRALRRLQALPPADRDAIFAARRLPRIDVAPSRVEVAPPRVERAPAAVITPRPDPAPGPGLPPRMIRPAGRIGLVPPPFAVVAPTITQPPPPTDTLLRRSTSSTSSTPPGPATPFIQMITATDVSITRQGLFTPHFLALQQSFTGDHVSFAKELDRRIKQQFGPNIQNVTRAYNLPEPAAFTLQRPWQIT